jgi:uncharacterized protein YaaW (UPF0174 family)
MISREQIFHVLPAEKLRDIARYLAFDPVVEGKLFSQLAESGKLTWLDRHRNELEDHLRWVGSSLFGKRRTYREIVLDTAKKIGAPHSEADLTTAVEQAIVSQVWSQALNGMTEEQRAKVRASITELVSTHGKQVGKELSGFAALGAAQLSGFGVYVAGSTLLGAINGALGLGLGFGAFTGLSSLISVVIGPVGWAALGLFTVAKLGGPNYKKIIPVIFVVATCRAESDAAAATPPPEKPRPTQIDPTPTATTPDETPVVRDGTSTEAALLAGVAGGMKADGLRIAFSMPEIRALEAEAKQLAGKKQRATKPDGTAARKPTKRERITFGLQNPLLCIMAKRLGDEHYLEMSPADQEEIRKLVQDDQESLVKEEKRRKQEVRIARRELEESDRGSSKKRKDIERHRKQFERLFPNLEFNVGAIERYLSLDEDRQLVAIGQFKQLDSGNSRDKHHVPRTDPLLFQRDGGSDLRIYYRQNGAPNRLCVHLVGTKATQVADYERMRGS